MNRYCEQTLMADTNPDKSDKQIRQMDDAALKSGQMNIIVRSSDDQRSTRQMTETTTPSSNVVSSVADDPDADQASSAVQSKLSSKIASSKTTEKDETSELSKKYGNIKPTQYSLFLQRKLAKKCKYFDSGDYNMAKARIADAKAGKAPAAQLKDPRLCTGRLIPTRSSILQPARSDIPESHQSSTIEKEGYTTQQPPVSSPSRTSQSSHHPSNTSKSFESSTPLTSADCSIDSTHGVNRGNADNKIESSCPASEDKKSKT